MTTLTLHATGKADAELAWLRYLEIERWAQWAPQIRRVECSAAEIAPGVTGRVVAVAGVAVDFVVEDVDRTTRTWSWRVRLGPVAMRLTHGVQEHPRGSRTSLTVSGPLPIVVGYVPVAALALRGLVAP